ncbi:hypothetical protein DV738_g1646, partial [Chaetothyriales sp. CBS 135597]
MDSAMDLDGPGLETSQLRPHQDAEVTRLWRTWRTVLEMLVDRGYQITEEELSISRGSFYNKFKDPGSGVIDRRLLRLKAEPTPDMVRKLTPRATKRDPNPATKAGTIWVEFCPDPTIGIKHTRAFAHTLQERNFSSGIFITIGPVTTSALRAFDGAAEQGVAAEHFREEDLLVNITKHELVPKHILLSDDEKRTLLDVYRLKETQLPRIQSSDPVAKYLGLKKGQVVKIIRKSETAGRYASYRWVF